MEKERENWFKKYSVEIQAFAMIILIGVTLYYAISTAGMADIMREEFKISNRPYVSIDEIEANYDNNKVIIAFHINNRGKIPARIINFNIKSEGLEESLDDAEMILHPGEVKIKGDLVFEKEGIQNISYKFQVQIEYYSFSDKEEKSKYCIEYHLFHNSEKKEINYQNVFSCE